MFAGLARDLTMIDQLASKQMDSYHLFQATRADLL